MKKHRFLLLSLAALVVLVAACSSEKKTEETAEQPAATTAASGGTTPIDQATVGEVTGKVTFDGAKPKQARIMMDQDPVCGKKHSGPVFAEDNAVNDNGTLPNVFIFVKSGAEKYAIPVPTESVTLDQDGCMYKPHVLALMVGQPLTIKNSDGTNHNVHAIPNANREWNESQPPGSPDKIASFPRQEIMLPIKCNIHPWMHGWHVVVKGPYAITDENGNFTIKNVPPGSYTVTAWQEEYGTQTAKVTVAAGQPAKADFTFKAK